MAKRDDIKELIERGGATAESLCQAVEVDKKGLASQLTYLRMMGVYPVKDENGVYKLVSEDEWNEIKSARAASGGGNKPVLTPAERLEKAQKREDRCSSALTNAKKRLEDAEVDEYGLLALNVQKCEIELKIASIKLSQAEALAGSTLDADDADVEADVEADVDADADADDADVEADVDGAEENDDLV
jgi:hypothetical protein